MNTKDVLEVWDEMKALVLEIGHEKARKMCIIRGGETTITLSPEMAEIAGHRMEKMPIWNDAPIVSVLEAHGIIPTKARIRAFCFVAVSK